MRQTTVQDRVPRDERQSAPRRLRKSSKELLVRRRQAGDPGNAVMRWQRFVAVTTSLPVACSTSVGARNETRRDPPGSGFSG